LAGYEEAPGMELKLGGSLYGSELWEEAFDGPGVPGCDDGNVTIRVSIAGC